MDIRVCFARAWKTLKRHPGPVLGGFLAMELLSTFAGGLLHGHAIGGLTLIARKAEAGGRPKLVDVFNVLDRFVDYILVWLCALAGGLFCGVGLVLSTFLFWFAPTIIAVDGVSWKQALARSTDLAQRHPGDLTLLIMVIAAVNLLGLLCLGLGLLVSWPMSQLITFYAYQQLSEPAQLAEEHVDIY